MNTLSQRLGHLIFTTVACFSCAGLIGCTAPSSSATARANRAGWTTAHLPGTTQQSAMDAAVDVMEQYFPGARLVATEGRIESGHREYDQRGGTGRIRDEALQFRNRMRQKATLTVQPQGSGSVAQCQIVVERLDTSDHRMFRSQSEFDDTAAQTPIDRDAGVTPQQSEVWTPMPRDRQRERAILDLLKSRLAQPDA